MIPEFVSASGPDTVAVSIPVWLDMSAVIVGALTGILVAKDRDLDLVGFVALSMFCGLGGGLIRDLIMQVGDVYMLKSPYAIPSTVAVGVVGFLFSGLLGRMPNLMNWADIVSVGLFVAAGTDKAIVYQLNPWACILMGTLTGVGGGMVRDVFLGEVPRIFQRSNLYALCAVAGALSYYLLVLVLYVTRPWAVALCVALVVATRMWSLRFHVLSPANVDLTPKAARAARVVYRRALSRGEHEGRTLVRRYPMRHSDDGKANQQAK